MLEKMPAQREQERRMFWGETRALGITRLYPQWEVVRKGLLQKLRGRAEEKSSCLFR